MCKTWLKFKKLLTRLIVIYCAGKYVSLWNQINQDYVKDVIVSTRLPGHGSPACRRGTPMWPRVSTCPRQIQQQLVRAHMAWVRGQWQSKSLEVTIEISFLCTCAPLSSDREDPTLIWCAWWYLQTRTLHGPVCIRIDTHTHTHTPKLTI